MYSRQRRKRKVMIYRMLLVLLGLVAVFIIGINVYKGISKHTDKNKEVNISDANDQLDNNSLGTVVLDAGHGGSDPGCMNGIYKEKDLTLDYTLRIGKYLEEHNVNVLYIRKDDSILKTDTYRLENGSSVTNDLRARAEYGFDFNADYYVSIHIDSAESASKGFTVYTHNGYTDSVELGNCINKRMNSLNYTDNRGVLDGSQLRVLRLNRTVPVLIELGFITGDLDYLIDNNNKDALATQIALGIIDKLKDGKKQPDLIIEKQPDLY